MVLRERGAVRRRRQRTFLLRHRHDLLAEKRHFLILVRVVEGDHVFQRVHRRGRTEPCQVLVQVRLELVEQHLEFGIAERSERRNIRGVDDHRTLLLHLGDGRVGEAIGGDAVAEQLLPDDADARAFESGGVERARVVGRRRPSRRGGRRIRPVDAGHRGEQRRGVGDGACHRTGGVLAVRDRHDAGAADEPERGLDADEAVARRRRHD